MLVAEIIEGSSHSVYCIVDRVLLAAACRDHRARQSLCFVSSSSSSSCPIIVSARVVVPFERFNDAGPELSVIIRLTIDHSLLDLSIATLVLGTQGLVCCIIAYLNIKSRFVLVSIDVYELCVYRYAVHTTLYDE